MQFWDLFQWWNLIFTLPFGIGLLPLLLQGWARRILAMAALLTCHTSAEVTYPTMLPHTVTRRPLRLRHMLQLIHRQWEARTPMLALGRRPHAC